MLQISKNICDHFNSHDEMYNISKVRKLLCFGKVMDKIKFSRLWFYLNMRDEREIHAILKAPKKSSLSYYGKIIEKGKYYKVMFS